MELNDLKLFYEIARYNSIVKASKVLNLNRSYLSKIIILLEKELGYPLFFRSGKDFFLTKEGQLFKIHSEQLRIQLLVMEKELGRSYQRIDIGITPDLANNTLNNSFTDGNVTLLVKPYKKLIEELLDNTIDFLITDQLFNNKYYPRTQIGTEKVAWFTSCDNPLEWLDSPIIISKEITCPCRDITTNFLKKNTKVKEVATLEKIPNKLTRVKASAILPIELAKKFTHLKPVPDSEVEIPLFAYAHLKQKRKLPAQLIKQKKATLD